MLISNMFAISEKLYAIRKRQGMTQLEVAENAGIAERTYADFERGLSNIQLLTLLRICEALHITPDAIFTSESTSAKLREEELIRALHECTPHHRETALRLLETYLQSLK